MTVPDAGPPPGRVLFTHASTGLYGADKSLVLLAGGLLERGWKVDVLIPARGTLAPALEAAGCRVHVGAVGAIRRLFTPSGWIRWALFDIPTSIATVYRLAQAADIVHVNTTAMVGAPLGAVARRRPFVLHVRESYADHARLWRLYARVIGRRAAAVLTNSDSVAEYPRAAGLGDRTSVVHNGIAFGSRLRPVADGPVVTAGRINSWKGHDVLVEAIALLRGSGDDVPLVIAGDAFPGAEEYEHALDQAIARHGLGDLVVRPGFVDDMPGLLAQASLFVLPSVRPEPFGLSLVEAMAAGLPCIATDAGGPREIIRPGVTGLLVPPGDAAALAAAIRRLRADPAGAARMGEAAAADVRERFGIDRTVARVERIYREVLSR